MTENEAIKKYVIIDKINGFGYASSKYADMFNMTMPEYATVFENKEVAEKIALSLNLNKGYKLQVFDYEEALLDIIKEEAKKVKESVDDNLTQNRMRSIVNSVEKLHKSLEEIQQYRAIGTVEEFKTLKEKSVAKKPRFYAHNYYCTECGNLVGNNEFEWQRFLYCDKCGQKLDWE